MPLTPIRIDEQQPQSDSMASPALRRLEPRTALVEQVVERIREGIFNGEFPPDSELPAEGTLAKTIGVSYTVMREAMRTLRSHGLVEISQGRRPRVKPAGPDAVRQTLDAMLRRSDSSIRELTELRRPLECEIAALAAKRASPDEIRQLEHFIQRQEDSTTIDEQIAADVEFHLLLARAASNMLFELVMSSVWDLLIESRRRTICHLGSAHALSGHTAVLDAIKCHDSEAARQAMRQHIDMIVEDSGT